MYFNSLKSHKWVFFSLLGWLIVCQFLFVMIQAGIGQKVVDSVENQLRQELDFSDFHYLARSVTDYNSKGAIKCAKITKTYPENRAILDLKYMSSSCTARSYFLNGIEYKVELKALNGDIYLFEFIALNPALFYLALWSFRLIGFLLVFAAFKVFKLREEKNKILLTFEKNIAAVTIAQAQQVAHDIRSPLSALNIMIPSMNALPEENRVIIRQAIQRINDIANELLHKKNKNTSSLSEKANVTTSIFLVAPVVDAIISEKRIQFRDKINVQIEVDLADSYGLFIDFNLAELKRIISNLINNSVEALPNNAGKIEIKVLNKEKTILIQIKDNGKGIPAHILKTLGQRGVSHGKEGTASGSGLGLYHAKTTIEQLGGSFELLSEVGIGTQINISISPANSPDWYIKKLSVSKNTLVVSVDDDVSIHGIWRNRLSGLQKSAQLATPIGFLSFTSTTEFSEWYKTQEPVKINSCVFLIDYEFINQKINGLDLIENLNLKATLVTSRYDDVNIQEKCHKLNIKLIPKSMAGLVPIEISATRIRYDLCLLDDDTQLIHAVWASVAESKGLTIKMFATPQAFFGSADSIDRQTPIYVDISLGDGIKGTDVSEEIHKLGFVNINLATGYDADSIVAPAFIRQVVGKDFPELK